MQTGAPAVPAASGCCRQAALTNPPTLHDHPSDVGAANLSAGWGGRGRGVQGGHSNAASSDKPILPVFSKHVALCTVEFVRLPAGSARKTFRSVPRSSVWPALVTTADEMTEGCSARSTTPTGRAPLVASPGSRLHRGSTRNSQIAPGLAARMDGETPNYAPCHPQSRGQLLLLLSLHKDQLMIGIGLAFPVSLFYPTTLFVASGLKASPLRLLSELRRVHSTRESADLVRVGSVFEPMTLCFTPAWGLGMLASHRTTHTTSSRQTQQHG